MSRPVPHPGLSLPLPHISQQRQGPGERRGLTPREDTNALTSRTLLRSLAKTIKSRGTVVPLQERYAFAGVENPRDAVLGGTGGEKEEETKHQPLFAGIEQESEIVLGGTVFSASKSAEQYTPSQTPVPSTLVVATPAKSDIQAKGKRKGKGPRSSSTPVGGTGKPTASGHVVKVTPAPSSPTVTAAATTTTGTTTTPSTPTVQAAPSMYQTPAAVAAVPPSPIDALSQLVRVGAETAVHKEKQAIKDEAERKGLGHIFEEVVDDNVLVRQAGDHHVKKILVRPLEDALRQAHTIYLQKQAKMKRMEREEVIEQALAKGSAPGSQGDSAKPAGARGSAVPSPSTFIVDCDTMTVNGRQYGAEVLYPVSTPAPLLEMVLADVADELVVSEEVRETVVRAMQSAGSGRVALAGLWYTFYERYHPAMEREIKLLYDSFSEHQVPFFQTHAHVIQNFSEIYQYTLSCIICNLYHLTFRLSPAEFGPSFCDTIYTTISHCMTGFEMTPSYHHRIFRRYFPVAHELDMNCITSVVLVRHKWGRKGPGGAAALLGATTTRASMPETPHTPAPTGLTGRTAISTQRTSQSGTSGVRSSRRAAAYSKREQQARAFLGMRTQRTGRTGRTSRTARDGDDRGDVAMKPSSLYTSPGEVQARLTAHFERHNLHMVTQLDLAVAEVEAAEAKKKERLKAAALENNIDDDGDKGIAQAVLAIEAESEATAQSVSKLKEVAALLKPKEVTRAVRKPIRFIESSPVVSNFLSHGPTPAIEATAQHLFRTTLSEKVHLAHELPSRTGEHAEFQRQFRRIRDRYENDINHTKNSMWSDIKYLRHKEEDVLHSKGSKKEIRSRLGMFSVAVIDSQQRTHYQGRKGHGTPDLAGPGASASGSGSGSGNGSGSGGGGGGTIASTGAGVASGSPQVKSPTAHAGGNSSSSSGPRQRTQSASFHRNAPEPLSSTTQSAEIDPLPNAMQSHVLSFQARNAFKNSPVASALARHGGGGSRRNSDRRDSVLSNATTTSTKLGSTAIGRISVTDPPRRVTFGEGPANSNGDGNHSTGAGNGRKSAGHTRTRHGSGTGNISSTGVLKRRTRTSSAQQRENLSRPLSDVELFAPSSFLSSSANRSSPLYS